MFEKLKQFKELKRIQEKIKKEKIEAEKQGTKVVLSGNLEIIETVSYTHLTLPTTPYV